jgi:hypothetical protein
MTFSLADIFVLQIVLICCFIMKIIPVLIINLRGSHEEMADLHATTMLYMNFRNIKGLLTEREVCTVKYQTEVF